MLGRLLCRRQEREQDSQSLVGGPQGIGVDLLHRLCGGGMVAELGLELVDQVHHLGGLFDSQVEELEDQCNCCGIHTGSLLGRRRGGLGLDGHLDDNLDRRLTSVECGHQGLELHIGGDAEGIVVGRRHQGQAEVLHLNELVVQGQRRIQDLGHAGGGARDRDLVDGYLGGLLIGQNTGGVQTLYHVGCIEGGRRQDLYVLRDSLIDGYRRRWGGDAGGFVEGRGAHSRG